MTVASDPDADYHEAGQAVASDPNPDFIMEAEVSENVLDAEMELVQEDASAEQIDAGTSDLYPTLLAVWNELAEHNSLECINEDFMRKVRICTDVSDLGDATRRIFCTQSCKYCFVVKLFNLPATV